MAMEPLHPSLDTPQRRPTSRHKDRKTIESYLKTKYPDSTFHHLKSANDREDCIDSKPIADQFEDVKSNIVSNQSLQSVKRSSRSYLKSKYPNATFRNLKIEGSSNGEDIHDSWVKADKSKDVKRCSSPKEDSLGDAKNPESEIRQSSALVGVDLKRKRGRPKKKNYPEFQNVESKSPIPKMSSSLQVNSGANGKQSSEKAASSANFAVEGIFAQQIMLLDNKGSVLDKSVFRIPPVVIMDRLKCNLYDALEEHGFISASRVTMEMGLTPHLAPYKIQTKHSGEQNVPFVGKTALENTPTKSLKSDFPCSSQELKTKMLEQVRENYETMDKTESKPFLGFSSPGKNPSYTECLTKPDHVLANNKSSRIKRNLSSSKEFSVRKDLGREYTVDARCNGSKKLEVLLHDFRVGKQFAKSKIVEESRSESKIRPVRTSKKRSSTQSKKICSEPRTLNRSNYSSKKSQTKLNIGKNARKVDDVVEINDSDEEQVCTNKIMLMQPIVMQQIFMPRILMHNYTYKLPSQGLQLVSGHLNPRFTNNGVKAERSDDDDLMNLACESSNADRIQSFSDSCESENERVVKSLIEDERKRIQNYVSSNPDCSELESICYLSAETKRVPPSIELEEYCYVSEDIKPQITSSGCDSAKKGDIALTESAESNEKMEGIKKDQTQPCSSELSIKKPLLYEESKGFCEVANQEEKFNKRVSPVKSAKYLDTTTLSESAETIERLEGAEDLNQPCSLKLSVDKLRSDEESTESCSKSPVIISDIPNQEENDICPIVNVSSVESSENVYTTAPTEVSEGIQNLEGKKEDQLRPSIPDRETCFSPVESAGRIEKLEGAEEEQHQPCSTESVGEPQLDEESMESYCESPVMHNDIPNQQSSYSPVGCHSESPNENVDAAGQTESAGSIDKLVGAEEDHQESCSTESVVEPQLDEGSMESYCEYPVMHNDIPDQQSSYSPVACHSESPNKNVDAAGQTESARSIENLEGVKEDQHQPCLNESVEKSQCDEGSMESYCKSPDMHNDTPNQKSIYNPVACHSESPNENVDATSQIESASSIEKLVGAEEDQQASCSTESVAEPQLDEESMEPYCEFSVTHNDIPNQESSFCPVVVHSKSLTENFDTTGLSEYAGCIENVGGTKELGASGFSVEKPSHYEDSTDSYSESPVIHNDNDFQEKNGFRQIVSVLLSPVDSAKHPYTITPTESSLGIQKLEGKKENQLQPERALLDDNSMETCNRSPAIHNDILNQDNSFIPVENQSVMPVYSVENIAILEEPNDGIDKSGGTKKQQLLAEESMESSRRLSLFCDRVLNQNNIFSPVTTQPIPPSVENQGNIAPIKEVVYDIHLPSPSESTVEKPQLKENGSESFSRLLLTVDDVLCPNNCWADQSLTAGSSVALGETIKCSLQSRLSVPVVFSEGSRESFKSTSSDRHDLTCADDDGVTQSVSTLMYVGNVEEQGELGNCSLSEISSCESLYDSSYHDTMEEDIPSSTLEDLVEEYPLDEKRWDNTNKLPLEPNGPNRPDFMQVESQLVENSWALSGVVSHKTDPSNIMRILDEVNQDTSVEPLLCSSLGETIQGAEIIHEKPSLSISSDSTVDSLNEATIDGCCILPELSRPSTESSSNELCGYSFTQELDGIKCSLREKVTPKTGVQNPLFESVGKPSVDSESPPPFGSAYHHIIPRATQHCSDSAETITPKGLSTSRMPLASFTENHQILGLVNDDVHPSTPGKIGALIEASRSSISVPTEGGDILENSGQIDEHFSCSNNTEFQDQEKNSVRTDTLIIKDTFFEFKSTPESIFNEQLSNKKSQENLTSDFLEMSDCTEAMVDVCLGENLPGSSGNCLPSLQMVESADFPPVSATSEVLKETVRENGQLAETGVVANLPVEFAYESPNLQYFPTINKASDLDVQSIKYKPNTDAELIFDGVFNETDEPIILSIEGDLNNDERKTGEGTQSQVLNSTQFDDVNLTLKIGHSSSTIEIRRVRFSEKVCLVQPPPDVSLIAIPQTTKHVERSKQIAILERKQPVNNMGKICKRVNNLLFDEEFEQNENVTPVKRSRGEKRMLPDSPISVGSKPSDLLFDEEFETSNNFTPSKKIRVGPSVTISRVHSRRVSELLFDEEFEKSNNSSPLKTQKCGNIVRAPSPRALRITSIGVINDLVIDENDEPPLNAALGSTNCIDERPVSKNSSVGCVVISSDEECETPPLNNLLSPINTNPATPICRPTSCLQNETKTDVNKSKIRGKRNPMATSSPRMVGKSKGRNPPLMLNVSLSPVFEDDLSDDGSLSEPADSPPRKISKMSPSREQKPVPLKLKGMVDLLGDGGEKNHSEQSSAILLAHCVPIEPDEVSVIDLDDATESDPIDCESQNRYPSSLIYPYKSKYLPKCVEKSPINSKSAENHRNLLPCSEKKSNSTSIGRTVDVIELTDSDTENPTNEVTAGPSNSRRYSDVKLSTDVSNKCIKSNKSLEAEKNDVIKPLSTSKPSTPKLLSIKGRKYIKLYSKQLVELAETINSVKGTKLSTPKDSQRTEDESNGFPCHPFPIELFNSTQKGTAAATLQNFWNSQVSAMESQVVEPSSYKPSLNSSFRVVSSKKCLSTNRFNSFFSKSPLPTRPANNSRKSTVIPPKNTVSRNTAPPNVSNVSNICRGIPLDGGDPRVNQINCGPSLSISRVASPVALLSKPVLSKQFKDIVKKPGTINRNVARTATPAEISKELPNKKPPSSVLWSVSSSHTLSPTCGVKTNQLPSRSGSPLHSKTGSRNRPNKLESIKLKKNISTIARPVLKMVSTSCSLGKDSRKPIIDLSDLDDDDDDDDTDLELSSCEVDDDLSPDLQPPKLMLSRQSLSFIKTVTRKSERPGNRTPATASTKKPPARGSSARGRVSRRPQKNIVAS